MPRGGHGRALAEPSRGAVRRADERVSRTEQPHDRDPDGGRSWEMHSLGRRDRAVRVSGFEATTARSLEIQERVWR